MTGLHNLKSISSKYPIHISFAIGLGIWILCLFSIGELLDVFEVSEAREGVVVKEIIDHGTWILPLRHGEIVPSKPPLFHYFSALLSIISGEFTEFELRLPSLIGAIFTLIITFIFLSKLANLETALIGSAILSTMYGFLQLSIDGRVDMLFNAFYICAYYVFTYHLLKNKPLKNYAYLISASVILSVLTKGPLGIILFILYSAPLIIQKESIQALKKYYFNRLSIITLFLSGAWYIVSSLLGTDGIFSRHIIFENIERFFGSSGITSKPFWYYFLHIWTQSLPWGPIILVLYLVLFFNKSTNKFKLEYKEKEIISKIFFQAMLILLFLSLSSGKRRGYLLMILPQVACISGIILYSFWDRIKENNNIKNIIKRYVKILGLLTLISSLIVSFTSLILKLFSVPSSISSKSFIIGFINSDSKSFLVVAMLCILLFFIQKFLILKDSKNYLLYAIFALMLQIYLAFPASFFLTKGESHSYMRFAEVTKNWSIENPESEIIFIKKRIDENFDTFFYYYGKRMRIQEIDKPLEQGLYIARKSWIIENLESNDIAYTPILEGGKGKESSDNYIVLFKTY